MQQSSFPNLLEVKGLFRDYGKTRAVDDVSFSIYENEIFSLLGPNGAGKTTTISMLATLISPTAGSASIGGYDIQKQAMKVRKMIGVVPQDLALYNDLTGMENLLFWGHMYDLSGTLLRKRAGEALDRIGLFEKRNERVKTYSGGMKRRLNIGVGLLHRPKILFMDEPTVGIDPQSRRRILDLVREFNQDGMSVLYTTHYMEEAEELSHRVGIIDHGKMIAVGTQEELTALVGEHGTLRLHLRGDQETSTDFLNAMRDVSGVVEVSRNDDLLLLNVLDAESNIADVIAVTNAYGVRINSVDIQEPNLETVFLHLTGRALRD